MNRNKPHITLRPPLECSIYPVYTCPVCGADLWTRKQLPNGPELCYTEDGKRHYKHRCNLTETPTPDSIQQPTLFDPESEVNS